MTALLKKDVEYSLEEYIELEKTSEEKFLFNAGKVQNLSNESLKHSVISSNILFRLKTSEGNPKSRIFSSNLKLKANTYFPYLYADGSITLGKPIIENYFGLDVLVNPNLIVEVLSDSTKSFDLGDKFTYYKSIESFTEYLLIDQDQPHVILYAKQTEDAWLQREFIGLEAKFYLTSLDCEISLQDIYENIEFEEAEFPMFPHQKKSTKK